MNTHEVPLRERVRAQLLELISEMDLTVNTRLLSEGQLAAKFQVSRSTIRTVLSDLEVEGKVIRRQGSGTYVNSQAIQVNTTLYPRIDLREIVARNGYSARSEVLSVRQIPAGRQSLLFNCGPTHQLQEIRSLYYADEFPCMYCIDCIRDGRITEDQWRTPELATQSIYEFLKEAGNIHVKWDMMRLRAATSGEVPELAVYFEVHVGKIRPFILLEITNYDDKNNPVLCGNIYVDTERIKLNLVRDLGQLS